MDLNTLETPTIEPVNTLATPPTPTTARQGDVFAQTVDTNKLAQQTKAFDRQSASQEAFKIQVAQQVQNRYAQVKQVEEQVASIKAQNEQLKTQLAGVRSEMTQTTSQLSSVNSQISSAQAEVQRAQQEAQRVTQQPVAQTPTTTQPTPVAQTPVNQATGRPAGSEAAYVQAAQKVTDAQNAYNNYLNSVQSTLKAGNSSIPDRVEFPQISAQSDSLYDNIRSAQAEMQRARDALQ